MRVAGNRHDHPGIMRFSLTSTPTVERDGWRPRSGVNGSGRRLGVNHEILHHGQLIVYANALGRAFPASWAAFGL